MLLQLLGRSDSYAIAATMPVRQAFLND